MEQKITLTLNRADAEMLVTCLRRRGERLCHIRQELCEPDEFEREELAFFEQESEVVERVLRQLDSALETIPVE